MSLQLATALLAGVTGLSASCSARAEMAWNFPTPVTPVARDTLAIHNEIMIVITVLFVVVFAIMIYSMVKHRKAAGHEPAKFTGPTGKLQWFWALVPFGILLFIDFVLMGIPAYHAVIEMEDTQTRADMVVKVTGLQWKWQYEYPGTDIKYLSTMTTPQEQIDNQVAKGEHYLLEVDNPLVLPVGKKVRVLLTSADVIHTWWVPQFGVKRDGIPGFLRETWVKIEEPGIYRGQCAELCGKGHGFMPVVVEALPEDEYEQWLQRKQAEMVAARAGAKRAFSKDELLAHGQRVYAQQCAVCHGAQGQGIPGAFPALTASPLVNGPLLAADGRLIADSHVDRVLNGKPGTAMQAFGQTLSTVDLAAVISFERNALGNARGDFIQPAQIGALLAGDRPLQQAAGQQIQPTKDDTSIAPIEDVVDKKQVTPVPPLPTASREASLRKMSKAELLTAGELVYAQHCASCHGPQGLGIKGVFPALSGNPLFAAPLLAADGSVVADSHLDRVLNGKLGTPMKAFRDVLSATELAAVVTYVRNALGNARGDLIQPAQIDELRRASRQGENA